MTPQPSRHTFQKTPLDASLPALILSAALIAAGLAAGCGGAAPIEADDELPEAFSHTGTLELETRWWSAFEDPGLDAAVEQALDNNLDLLAAWERLRAARAVVEGVSGERLPWVDATAGARYEYSTSQGSSFDPTIGLQASYEVDLWGRIDAAIDAEQYRAEATEADAHAASISLTAEIALTWARIGAAEEQLDLIDVQLETNETILHALRERFLAGSIRVTDVLRQEALQEATLQERQVTLARREVARHRLAVLLGEPPQSDVDSPTELIQPPPLPSTGVPADLIRRRPDVRSEFLLLQAADSDLAAAISARFPRLTLSASVSSGGPTAQDIFRDWAMGLAADLLAPIFRGGQLEAEVDRTEAVRRERLFLYRQAILEALREVEDALELEQRQREQVARIEARIALTERTFEQLALGYQNGAVGFLDVLVALNDLQTLRRALVDARLALSEQRIGLCRALAGPIVEPAIDDDPERDPDEADTTSPAPPTR